MRFSFFSKKPITTLLLIVPMLIAPLHIHAKESAQDVQDMSTKWWSTGGSALQDGVFTATASSLLGWGVGGIVAIAIVAALFGSESGSSSHSH